MNSEQLNAFQAALGQIQERQEQQLAQLTRFATLFTAELDRLTQLAEQFANPELATKVNALLKPTLQGFEELGRIGGVELAMEITGKARSTIYNLASAGQIPVARNGGRLRFTESALRAYSFNTDKANG